MPFDGDTEDYGPPFWAWPGRQIANYFAWYLFTACMLIAILVVLIVMAITPAHARPGDPAIDEPQLQDEAHELRQRRQPQMILINRQQLLGHLTIDISVCDPVIAVPLIIDGHVLVEIPPCEVK